MPNGADRNFVRFIRCIETFRIKYNKWPTRVRLDPSFIRELQEAMSDEDHKKLNDKIMIIPDDSNPYDGLYIAENDEGDVVDLIRSEFISGDADAIGWLKISWPDYGPDL